MTMWLSVALEVDGRPGEVVEVPLEPDFTLLLSSLTSQFEKARGLRYRNEATGTYRAVRCTDDKLHPPEGDWGTRTYIVVEKSVTPASSAPAAAAASMVLLMGCCPA